MNISPKMARAFNKAVSLSENLYDDGTINWNFVDADVYSDMAGSQGLLSEVDNAAHYDAFHFLADQFLAANPELASDVPTAS